MLHKVYYHNYPKRTNEFPFVLNQTERKDSNQFQPKVNISESKENLKIEMALPGIKREDISIDIDKGVLSVRSIATPAKDALDGNFIRKEFDLTSFERSFKIPEIVDINNISARHEDGILFIELPRKEKEKKREITVM